MTRFAVDGIDCAGKTTFADRLAPLLERPVVRASEDDFLHPAAIRSRARARVAASSPCHRRSPPRAC